MTKEDKKEELLKKLKNMEDKNEKLLNTSNVANKGKTAKNESNFNLILRSTLFTSFTDILKNLREWHH